MSNHMLRALGSSIWRLASSDTALCQEGMADVVCRCDWSISSQSGHNTCKQPAKLVNTYAHQHTRHVVLSALPSMHIPGTHVLFTLACAHLSGLKKRPFMFANSCPLFEWTSAATASGAVLWSRWMNKACIRLNSLNLVEHTAVSRSFYLAAPLRELPHFKQRC